MTLIVTVFVGVCFIASLLPFIFPGTLIDFLGRILNDVLGDPLWVFVPVARGALVRSGSAGPVLTLPGVLVLYLPLLLLLVSRQRGR